jgi:hypothetical protein
LNANGDDILVILGSHPALNVFAFNVVVVVTVMAPV